MMKRTEVRLTTKRFGTYLIFDEAVSTFIASCSSSIKRFFNDLACPLIETSSSSYPVAFPFVFGGVNDFLNQIFAFNVFGYSFNQTFD
jgi:hypothetical protein